MSRHRHWLFRSLALGGSLILAELLAWTWLSLVLQGSAPAELRIQQQQIATGAMSSDGATETIHPFLGWVHNPQLAVPEHIDGRLASTNALGFRDNGPSILKRSPDQLIIGITGGSVAWRFSWEAEARLRELLAKVPEFANRQLHLVRLALPGYKQPQQLFSLSYVLALGGEFDAIINFDGFNDGVLAVLENARQGTAIEYPRSWHARSLLITDPRQSSEAWQLLSLRAARQTRARSALQSPLRFSSLYQLIWMARDEAAKTQLLELAAAVVRSRRDSFVHHGPAPPPQDQSLRAAADLWARSSQQMHDLCTAKGIRYLHCLQPSQYLQGTKTFSQFELEFCRTPGQPHAVLAAEIFPLLQTRGQELAKAGVSFIDLTGLFTEHPETLYADPWCHVNATGSRLFADAIAPALVPSR
ncbi:MAG: hypothetical protein ACKO2P_03810 [Planctomycetota bacterium]